MFHEEPDEVPLDSVDAVAAGLIKTAVTIAAHIDMVDAMPLTSPSDANGWKVSGDAQLFTLLDCLSGDATTWMRDFCRGLCAAVPACQSTRHFMESIRPVFADVAARVHPPRPSPSYVSLTISLQHVQVHSVDLRHTTRNLVEYGQPRGDLTVCVGVPVEIWRDRRLRWCCHLHTPNAQGLVDLLRAVAPPRVLRPAAIVAQPDGIHKTIQARTHFYIVADDARLAILFGATLPTSAMRVNTLLRYYLHVKKDTGLPLTSAGQASFYFGDDVPCLQFVVWEASMAFFTTTYVSLVVASPAEFVDWPPGLTLPTTELATPTNPTLELPIAIRQQWPLAQALLSKHPDYRPLLLHWAQGTPALGEFIDQKVVTDLSGHSRSRWTSPVFATMHVIRQIVALATPHGVPFRGPEARPPFRFATSFHEALRTSTGCVFCAIPALLDVPMLRSLARAGDVAIANYSLMLTRARHRFCYVYEDLDLASRRVVAAFHADAVAQDFWVTYWVGGEVPG
jgi:hypothetical protein